MQEQMITFLNSMGFQIPHVEMDGMWHDISLADGKWRYVAEDQGEGKALVRWGKYSTGQILDKIFGYAEGDVSWKPRAEALQKALTKWEKDSEKARQFLIQDKFSQLESTAPQHKYIIDQGLSGLFGAKVNGQELLVPMHDYGGKIWNVQKIMPDKSKVFTPGARTTELVCFLGKNPRGLKHAKHIGFCEGFATGAAIQTVLEAKGETDFYILCTMSSAQMLKTGVHFYKKLEKFPGKKWTVYADNDYTKDTNAGHNAANLLSTAIGCDVVLAPQIAGGSDFADVLKFEGLDKTYELLQIEAGPSVTTKSGTTVRRLLSHYSDIEPYPAKTSTLGKVIPPDDYELAQYVLDYFDTRWGLAKYKKDIFIYQNSCWNLCDEKEYDGFNNTIQAVGGGNLGTNKVATVYTQFKRLIRHMDRDPWVIDTELCNLANVTLEIKGKDVIAREHRKEDWCIYKIPVNYEPGARNPMFEGMLSSMFAKDPLGQEKIRGIQEMYGACLFPKFPKIFLLYGRANRGKTTLILPATRLVDKENISYLGPHEFKEFSMENMVGKLVNVDTDIDTHKTIQDAPLRKIEDRIPVTMNRKGRTMVKVPMPAVHIFGANDLPKTNETSEAHERRWLLINLSDLTLPETTIIDYGNKVFDSSPSGILNWALEGFRRVLSNGGKFSPMESSRASMEQWRLETDVVAQFIGDIKEGQVKDIVIRDGDMLLKEEVWQLFLKWYERVHDMKTNMKRHVFWKGFGARFSEGRKSKGATFKGVGPTVSDI